MDFILYFLILLVPGLIAAKSYSLVVHEKHENIIANALIFDLLIFIINITVLFHFKCINSMCKLNKYFECLNFTRKYVLLSILVGLILSVILGCICNIYRKKCKKHCDKPCKKSLKKPFEESFEKELMDTEKIKENFK